MFWKASTAGPQTRVLVVSALVCGGAFALGALEQGVRAGGASTPAVVLGLLGLALLAIAFIASRDPGSATPWEARVRSENPVLKRLMAFRTGPVALSVYISGMVLSGAWGWAVEAHMPSLVLLLGLPLLMLGAAWMFVLIVLAGLGLHREARGGRGEGL